MTDEQPDPGKIKPLLLAGRNYCELGGPAGVAWKEGISMMKK